MLSTCTYVCMYSQFLAYFTILHLHCINRVYISLGTRIYALIKSLVRKVVQFRQHPWTVTPQSAAFLYN